MRRFDYIARDGRAIGDQQNLSLARYVLHLPSALPLNHPCSLIRSARVIDDQICYDIKDANQIYELCYTRFSLHKRIYSHKTARAVECMLVDALGLAAPPR